MDKALKEKLDGMTANELREIDAYIDERLGMSPSDEEAAEEGKSAEAGLHKAKTPLHNAYRGRG